MAGNVTSPRPRHRRSWWALGAFALGLWLGDRSLVASGVWFSISAALAAAGVLWPGRWSRVVLLLVMISLGAGWWTLRQREVPEASLARLLTPAQHPHAGPLPLSIDGFLLESPAPVRSQRGTLAPGMDHPSVHFRLAVRHAIDADRSRPASGTLHVTVRAPTIPARAGDFVRVTGMAEGVEPPANPGEYDFRPWAADRGQVGSIMTPEASLIEVVNGGPISAWDRAAATWWRARAWMHDRAAAVLDRACPPTSAGDSADEQTRALILSLFIGQTDPSHPEIDAAFNRLGLAHVLAISGFHVVILAWAALQLVRLTGERGRLEAIIVAGLVIVYLLIVPPGAPVARAGVMVLIMLASEALERRYDRVTLLGWIGLGLLVWRPADLYSLGFPLSLCLTAVLLWMGSLAHERLWGIQLRGTLERHGGALPWISGRVKELLASSLLCWSLATPLLLLRVGLLSPAAVLGSVILTPLIVPAMALGFAILIIGMAIPAAADVLGPLLGALMRWTLDVVFWLESFPGASVRIVGLSPLWAFGATLLTLVWFRAGHWRARGCWLALVVLLVWGGVLITRAGRLPPDVGLRVDALAVGDGNCQLVRASDAGHVRTMLIDCGSTRTAIGRRLIPDALRALGVRSLDMVVLSRPDPTRYAALADLIQTVRVDRVIIGPAFASQADTTPLGPAGRLLTLLESRGIPTQIVHAGDHWNLGEADVEVLWPGPEAPTGKQASASGSLVTLVSSPGGAALFTSDIREDAIGALRRERPELRAAIVEVPAHGAVSVASEAWMRELAPRVIVQSTGARRAGDSRWDAARRQSTWLTTATDGACWVEITRGAGVRRGSISEPSRASGR